MMRPSHKIIYTLFISFVWHHHKVDGLENEFVSEDVQSQLLRLKEDIKVLKESYREVLSDVTHRHKEEIQQHQTQIQELKSQVHRLETLLSKPPVDFNYPAAGARTCEELRSSDKTLASGLYWIDPDGLGSGDAPIHVFCNMTSGSTSILHDSEQTIDVGHCWDAGCYSRIINYQSSMRQMVALMEISSICTQSIQYDCKSAPLEFNGVAQSWWTDRKGDRQLDFTGSGSTRSKCQCGLDNSCIDKDLLCNCNAVSPVEANDTGFISDKSLLPVTRLHFGRILSAPARGLHTLSRLQCFGRQFIISEFNRPSSCMDLWRAGHTHSGFYFVESNNDIKHVFCDMTDVPGQSTTSKTLVTQEKFDSLSERIEQLDSVTLTHNRRQSSITNRLQNLIQLLNTTLKRQNQTISAKIQKLETAENRLGRDVKSLAISRQRQSAEIAELKNKTVSSTPIRGLPKSCHDLKQMGHVFSGIYPLRGDTNIEMVFCDMSTTGGIQQKWLGIVDVKSSSVHFYVQRNTSFPLNSKTTTPRAVQAVLPFEIVRSNRGNAMNIRTGVFTVPITGTYVFTFSAIKLDKARYVNVYLYVNETEKVASVYGSQHTGFFSLSLQSLLHLKVNDRVQLVVESLQGGGIYDDKDSTTQFGGFLLEEDLF